MRDLQDAMSTLAYGMTKAEAHKKGVCIDCKKPPVIETDAEKAEYQISGLCGPCFILICKEAADGYPDNPD